MMESDNSHFGKLAVRPELVEGQTIDQLTAQPERSFVN
jgi:hypothetical protein